MAKARKFALPVFLEGVVVQADYEAWLRRRTAAHLKRDRKRGNKLASGETYRTAIHQAVVRSNGRDTYTGEALDWNLLRKFINAEAQRGKRLYKAKFARLPTVDHLDDGLGPGDFAICGWEVNDAKGALSYKEFRALCQKAVNFNRQSEKTEKKAASSTLTELEREIVVLNAAWGFIKDMVNFSMFPKFHDTKDIELRFNSGAHLRLFNILLTDFLSQPNSLPFELPAAHQGSHETDRSVLFYLRLISSQPFLNPSGDDQIKKPVDAFVSWLETEASIEKVWLPAIKTETQITVKRIAFIKICGNIAKHNFIRLSENARMIQRILAANGVIIDDKQSFLVLPEFYDWFHRHIFSYHASAIAEFLNNIRWGIYEYLRPEFDRSFIKDDPTSIAYSYQFPPECVHPMAQAMYWDLMNAVRSPPYMSRFEVTRFLKMRY